MARRSAADDDEYRRNYAGFEYVHALYALDHGWTGTGVLVGVADDGVSTNAELTGQVSALSKDFGTVTSNGQTTDRKLVGDQYSDHGTMVAGVIAGLDDGSGIQGIAPGAGIVALRVSDVNTSTNEETLGRTLPAALDYAAANGIRIVNASLAKVDAGVPSQAWSDMVARYTASGGLFVNAAGNDGEANAKGYLDLNAANRDGWLFVTAVEENETELAIGDYANRCGAAAMARCVAAIGTNATMDVNGNLVWFTGTSSAAGQVSGLAALILSKWPQLTGVQAGQVILNTAHDMGESGVDPVYGAGLIDVQAALSPVSPTLSNGVAQTAVAGSAMIVPEPVKGAGAAVKAMLANVTVLDAYGRDYSGSLAGLVAHQERRSGAFARQVMAGATSGGTSFQARGFTAQLGYTSYQSGPNPQDRRVHLTTGTASAVVGGARIVATYSGQDAVQDEAMGLAPASDVTIAYVPGANLGIGLEHAAFGGHMSLSALTSDGEYGSARGMVLGWSGKAVRVKAGYLSEDGTLFGAPVGTGALRFGNGARTAFLEASHGWSLGHWSLDAYASLGATRLKIGSDTLLTSASSILTQRTGLSASHQALGGRVRLGLALPLVAFAGAGYLTHASAYDEVTRSLVYSRDRLQLTGRYDPVLSLGYDRAGRNSALRMAAATNAAADDWRALASWRVTLP